MDKPSLASRFVKVARHFGIAIAVKVTVSKIRGLLFPALALPDGFPYVDAPRQLSFLVDASQHEAATLEALVDLIAAGKAGSWEICVLARPSLRPGMGPLLRRLRGTRPWIRIVETDASVDARTAAQYVVEQATGEFVGLFHPLYVADGSLQSLVDRLQQVPASDAAAFYETDGHACAVALHRKRSYLASQFDQWPLTAPAWAERSTGIAVLALQLATVTPATAGQ